VAIVLCRVTPDTGEHLEYKITVLEDGADGLGLYNNTGAIAVDA
jgi:hypothetical protein